LSDFARANEGQKIVEVLDCTFKAGFVLNGAVEEI
jgi:hypothetical protein